MLFEVQCWSSTCGWQICFHACESTNLEIRMTMVKNLYLSKEFAQVSQPPLPMQVHEIWERGQWQQLHGKWHTRSIPCASQRCQGYALVQQLCVTAFLALHPHAPQLITTVQLMLGMGLPSFKGEATIRRLCNLFVLGLSEYQAANFMMAIIKKTDKNLCSTVYDRLY